MKKCILDSDARMDIMKSMMFPPNEPEMDEAESAFLCGLIKQDNPRSIVEVGIAGGGTTAIILQCINKRRDPWNYYAVDCSERFYRDTNHKTGWLADEANNLLKSTGNFSLLLGKSLPFVIDQICNSTPIDFILLDTMHILPGEILDFLLVYPYLSSSAIVCLHDISLNSKSTLGLDQIATNVLFNSVVADKIVNLDLISSERNTYPNIAAFRVNNDTRKYISNVFGLLSLTWSYIPPIEEIDKYRDYYCKFYDEECIEIFDRAYAINRTSKSSLNQRIRKATKILLKGRF